MIEETKCSKCGKAIKRYIAISPTSVKENRELCLDCWNKTFGNKLSDLVKTKKAKRLPAWEWQEIRSRILARDNYTCTLCKKQGVEVDHIVPKCLGGTDADHNLRTLCEKCHKLKTKKDVKTLSIINRVKKIEKQNIKLF